MASLTLNFSIGDFITPIKQTIQSLLSKDKCESFIHTFDIMALRLMAIVILIGTIIVIGIAIPELIHYIIKGIINIKSIFDYISKDKHLLMNISQFVTLLPILLMSID